MLGSFCIEQLLMLPAMGGDAEKDFKKEGRMSRDFSAPVLPLNRHEIVDCLAANALSAWLRGTKDKGCRSDAHGSVYEFTTVP